MPLRIRCALALASGLCALAGSSAVYASNLTYLTTVTNTDVASFGMGYLRGNGTGSLSVTGLSGTVNSAYAFWHGPSNSTSPTANASVNFGGSPITGTSLGLSDNNFWGYNNSQAYRADVTSLITGNGIYSLSNFIKPGTEVNGLSLIVFFDDGNLANNQDVVLFNGNDANFNNAYDADGWNATLNGINYTSGSASLTLHVSDGQNFGATDDGTLLFNGGFLASGGLFQGNGVQFGNGNTPSNGALWDIENYDVTSYLTPGNNNVSIRLGGTNDALSLIVAQFNLPVGAAPPPPPSSVPEPATWAMLLTGFGLIGASSRRSLRAARTA